MQSVTLEVRGKTEAITLEGWGVKTLEVRGKTQHRP